MIMNVFHKKHVKLSIKMPFYVWKGIQNENAILIYIYFVKPFLEGHPAVDTVLSLNEEIKKVIKR